MLLVLPLLACVIINDAEYEDRLGGPSDDSATCNDDAWYVDADGDGWGDPADSTTGCTPPEGRVDNSLDCDDQDADIGAGDVWYRDADGDGSGATDDSLDACSEPEGYVLDANDCDDADAAVHPGALETCATSKDDDCNGQVDEVDARGCTEFYQDGDHDGYGTGESVCHCVPTTSEASAAGDCDDTTIDRSPGNPEVCNDGVDNDCDGGAGPCELPSKLVAADAFMDIVGESNGDDAGTAVAFPGDVTGDGFQDLAVGAPGRSGNKGAAYVVPGPFSAGSINLSDALTFQGATGGDEAGAEVVGGRDLDHNGTADLVLGGWRVGADAGAVYVVLGPITGSIDDVADYDGTSTGTAANALAGRTLEMVPSVDGDANDDLLVGAPGENGGANCTIPSRGAVFLVLGPATGEGSLCGLAAAVWFGSTAGDAAGTSLSSGDLTGDGNAEFITGAPGGNGGNGAVYVVEYSGPETSELDVGFERMEGSSGDRLGSTVEVVGDLDGDGTVDFAATGGSEVWLFAGTAAADFSEPLGILSDSAADPSFGTAVSSAGDANGDGQDDLLVSAPLDDSVYLFFGPVSGAAPDVLIRGTGGDFGSDLDGGFRLDGTTADGWIVGAPNQGEGDAFVFLGSGI